MNKKQLEQRTLEFITDPKYGQRPRQADCKECDGYGFNYFGKERAHCLNCLGTGLDAIPWSELFTDGFCVDWNG